MKQFGIRIGGLLLLVVLVAATGGFQIGSQVDNAAELDSAVESLEESFSANASVERRDPVYLSQLDSLNSNIEEVDSRLKSINPLSDELDAAAETFATSFRSTILTISGAVVTKTTVWGFGLSQWLPAWAIFYPATGVQITGLVGYVAYSFWRVRNMARLV